MRVLCVCLGNICRSPTAEAVLRQLSGGRLDVDSVGTGAWHIGKPPYGPAIAAAALRGYDLKPLRARQLASDDFDKFDLILAMDEQNLVDIENLRPAGNTTPVKLFLNYAPQNTRRGIPDPYYTRDFEEALDLIEAAAHGVIAAV